MKVNSELFFNDKLRWLKFKTHVRRTDTCDNQVLSMCITVSPNQHSRVKN